MKKNEVVAVVFGGVSNENEISVITGTMAANVLKNGGEEVLPVYIAQNGDMYAGEELADINRFKKSNVKKRTKAIFADGGIYLLSNNGKIKKYIKLSCVLNCCHGGAGEGGGLSGLCQVAKLPIAGEGIFASSAFMDKCLTKIVLQSLGVNVAPYLSLNSSGQIKECARIGFPVIVKPAHLGSSIGVNKADTEEELKAAVDCALVYDTSVIIETYIENRREINCAAYFAEDKIHVSECEEAISRGELLTFEDKYCGGGKSVIPADIPVEIAEYIKETTRTVYEKLNMRGIVRFDYILSNDGAKEEQLSYSEDFYPPEIFDRSRIYLSEINTVPGSLAYYLFAESFKNFYGILRSVISQAKRDFIRSSKPVITTGILENLHSNACKSGRK